MGLSSWQNLKVVNSSRPVLKAGARTLRNRFPNENPDAATTSQLKGRHFLTEPVI